MKYTIIGWSDAYGLIREMREAATPDDARKQIETEFKHGEYMAFEGDIVPVQHQQ